MTYGELKKRLLELWQSCVNAAQALLDFVYNWFYEIGELISTGNTDALPVGEILLAVIAVNVTVIVLFRLLRLVLCGSAKSTASSRALKRVELHGRWSAIGTTDPYATAEKQRLWREKVMTPEQQEANAIRVQKREQRKRRLLKFIAHDQQKTKVSKQGGSAVQSSKAGDSGLIHFLSNAARFLFYRFPLLVVLLAAAVWLALKLDAG